MAGGQDSPDSGAGTGAVGRYLPFGKKPLRTFALVIGLPAFLLYVVSAMLLLAALVMMAREMDRLEEQRAVTAMAAAVTTFLNQLGEAVADEGTWNEAHLNVVVKANPAWMDETWGATARLASTYDDVIVTDQEGLIHFGENAVGPITGVIGDHYPAATTMLEELDAAITASGDAAVITHFATDAKGAAAGLAAISIHQSNTTGIAVPRHQRRILWIGKHFTPSILQEMAIRYQVPLARIIAQVEPGMSSIALRDGQGGTAGLIGWYADKPGEVAFRHAAFLVTSAFVGVGILLVLGLRALRRAMLRRAAQIESVFAEQVQDSQVAIAAAEVVAATAKPVAEAEAKPSPIEGVTASDFAVEYQPIFDLRAESLIGVEALLRWRRQGRDDLLQEDLTSEENASMTDRSGIIALRHAAGELAPLLGVTLSMSINAEQLQSSVFAEKVGGTLIATNFQIRRLQLHVDAALLPPIEKLSPHMAELRGMGATVAFSNFVLNEHTAPYMRQGLADRICLAQSMISGIDADPIRYRLLEATIEAAREVGFAVTVPFVERKEEASRLLRLGCREFRGPLLSPPMPLAALTSLILAPARPAKTG